MTTREDNVVQGQFSALGHAGSDSFVGLEIIRLEEVMRRVTFQSDEFTAVCPVTKQPDLYDLEIELHDTAYSIESKSLKIYLGTFRNQGCFAENLAVRIKNEVYGAIEGHEGGGPILHADQVTVTITQKRRGGIEIVAVA